MNKVFKLIPCLAIFCAMAACSDAPAPSTQQATTAEATPTTPVGHEEQTEYVSPLPDDAPVIAVATTPTAPPFSFQDEYGNMIGIDIDTIRAIGEEEGFKVDFYPDTFANMFSAVESGNRDLAISAISYNADRAGKYALSNSYFINPSVIMYKDASSKIENLSDLQGKRVGVMGDSKQAQQLASANISTDLLILPSTFSLFEALVQDKVDAILGDEPLLQYTALKYPEYQVTIVPYENAREPSAQQIILMAKSNQELLDKVNSGIDKINSNGKMQAIIEKYLGPSRVSN